MNNKPQLASNVRALPIGDYYLLIRPSTGAWVVVDQRGFSLATSLNGDKSISQIIQDYSAHFQYPEVSSFIQTLDTGGVLEPSSHSESTSKGFIKKPTVAVLNLTENCNMACAYCYVNAGTNTKKMSSETAIKIIDDMLLLNSAEGETAKIIFHGGEPLLNFQVISDAVTHVRNHHASQIQFEVQTNASVLTKDHVRFFKEHSFNVGISIDGPKPLHDITRPLKTGTGSYDKVVNGIDLLKREGINFGAIVVLTSHNWDHIEEILDLFIYLGITTFSLNPFFPAGTGTINNQLSLNGHQIFHAYKSAIKKIADYNLQSTTSENKIEERTIKYLIRNITLKDRQYMCMRTPCGAGIDTVGFDTNGDVYLCDCFIGVPQYKIGNIHQASLRYLLNDYKKVKTFIPDSIDEIPACTTCLWRKLCNGICPAHNYFQKTINDRVHPECLARQQLLPHLMERLATGTLHPSSLDREWKRWGKTHLYVNINYRCNSRCTFCASDNTIAEDDTEIDLSTFTSILALNGISLNDYVTINGGEPTLSPNLIAMLKSVQKKGAYSHLFTNGRRLSEKEYCEQLLDAGVSKISIPLFGLRAHQHDKLTGVQDSFSQTITGIQNILSKKTAVEIELKLLFCKPTLKDNPKVLEWIIDEFPTVDTISLNALIVSRTVLLNWNALVAPPHALLESVNATLDTARKLHVEHKIRINDVPYCMVEQRNRGFLPPQDEKYPTNERYFDPSCIGGLEEQTLLMPDFCSSCLFLVSCGFINRQYYNSFITVQSLNAMFPGSKLIEVHN